MKAGMISLQCKNCVIHTWALLSRASHNGALYKYSFILPFNHEFLSCFSFLSFLYKSSFNSVQKHLKNGRKRVNKSSSVWRDDEVVIRWVVWCLVMQDPVSVRRLPLSHADVHHKLVLRHRCHPHCCRHLQVHRVQRVRFAPRAVFFYLLSISPYQTVISFEISISQSINHKVPYCI